MMQPCSDKLSVNVIAVTYRLLDLCSCRPPPSFNYQSKHFPCFASDLFLVQSQIGAECWLAPRTYVLLLLQKDVADEVLEMVRFLRAASGCVQSLADLCSSSVKGCEEKLLASVPKYVTGFRSSSSVGGGGGLYFSQNERLHGYHSLSTARKGPEARFTRSYATEAQEPRKTSLYDLHVALQGKMVPFGGFLLPVSYGAEGIAASHVHTRQHCSLFDVSHMMQTEVRGRDRLSFLESITTVDLVNLPDNTATLTVFTDPLTGGILDDLIITKTTLGYFHVVSNASRRSHDQKLLKEAQAAMRARGKDVDLRFLDPDEQALLALQGPDCAKVLQAISDVDLSHLYFMESTLATVGGVSRCRVTRCGYTGEDGVEISLPADQATKVAEMLLASEVAPVKPAGLGARDSLRLEAGMCLYGNDIDHTTTPVEAGLSWVVAKRRRTTADFPGASVIIDQLRDGPGRKRVGIKSRGPPARTEAVVYAFTESANEDIIGYITSGCPSPSLGGNVAMGYVRTEMAKPGTKVLLKVRDKRVEGTVCKLPFLPSKYYVRR